MTFLSFIGTSLGYPLRIAGLTTWNSSPVCFAVNTGRSVGLHTDSRPRSTFAPPSALNRLLVVFSVLFTSAMACAQTFTLQGKVLDEQMSPIEFATVHVPTQAKTAITSLKGTFTLTLQKADSVVVEFSMIGYASKRRVLHKPSGKQNLQVVLYPSASSLGEVEVTGKRRETGWTQKVDLENLKHLPTATGNGVESLLQSQAGVTTHNELSSQYNVRGGAFDENSVCINNVEMYRPFLVRSGQQEGLSVINPDMVEQLSFSTGGFEAKYSDKMSSALDIRYKKLHTNTRKLKTEGSARLSLLANGVYLGVGNSKLSWLNSIRYKTTQNLLHTLDTKGEYKPRHVDFQTYLSYKLSKSLVIDFIGNISHNRFLFLPASRTTSFGTLTNVKSFKVYFDGQENDVFKTYFGAVGLKWSASPQHSISLVASAFSTDERERYDIQGQYWLTQTETSETLGVGTYFSHARNTLNAKVGSLKLQWNFDTAKHQTEAGVTWKKEWVKELANEYEMRDSSGFSIPHTGEELNMIYSLRAANELRAHRIEAYLQDAYRFQRFKNTDEQDTQATLYTLRYGLRLSHWTFNHETLISPRLALGIIPAFNDKLTFRIATGLYYQAPFFKELRDTVIGRTGITRAYINNTIKSQRSLQFVGGVDYDFKVSGRPFKFTTEVYYKWLTNMIPYTVNNVKVTYLGNQNGKGHVAGIDLKLFGEFVPGTDSWLTLSLMDTRLQADGKQIPLPTDQRYAIHLFFTDYFPGSDRWKMLLQLTWADGLPFAAPHRELSALNFRAPAYRRVDIGMSYRLLNNEQRERRLPIKNMWIGLDCLNLFGISNVNAYYWISDVTGQQFAIPNYLTGRMLNAKLQIDF